MTPKTAINTKSFTFQPRTEKLQKNFFGERPSPAVEQDTDRRSGGHVSLGVTGDKCDERDERDECDKCD